VEVSPVRTPRLAASFAAAVLLGSARLLAQTEGIAEFRGTVHTDKGKTIPSQGKVYLSKAAVRVEWETDLSSVDRNRKDDPREIPNHFRMTMIQRIAEPDRTYMVNDERKTYSIQMIDDKRERPDRSDKKWKVQKLGRDTVGGFSCEKALLTSEDRRETEVCIATDLVPSTAWLRAWNRREEQATPLQALKDAGLTGFPVRWIFREKGSTDISSSIELQRFDKKSLPASLFEIPAGYRKVDTMMEAMAMTPEQERSMREAQKKMQEALDKMSPEERRQYEEMMRRYAPTPHN
jgi:Domain of unknown function (DUF4412)